LRLTGYWGMAEFAEIDLDKRLAVVGARARPSVSFHQSTGSLWEIVSLSPSSAYVSISTGMISAPVWPDGHHPDTAYGINLWLRAGLPGAGALARRAGVNFTKVQAALLQRRSPDGAKRNPGKSRRRIGGSRVALRFTRATR
jgi:hypothetical protein